MSIRIEPFRDKHLDAAAALLAARQAADRRLNPELPAQFEQIAIARETLQTLAARPATEGLVALDNGRPRGYLLGSMELPEPASVGSLFVAPRSLSIAHAGHAVAAEDGFETYRALYAAMAPRWVERGFFTHYVSVTEGDGIAAGAWNSLGFGQELVFGVRDLAPIQAPDLPGIEIHRASSEDIETVFPLVWGLYRYHAGPPIYLPCLPETVPAARERTLDSLAAPDCASWLAYQDGRAVALNEYTPPTHAPPITAPERSTYLLHGFTDPEARGAGIGSVLLQRSLAWAREEQFERVTINWFSANVGGGRFWRRAGFRPLTYRLLRRVDERVAWGR